MGNRIDFNSIREQRANERSRKNIRWILIATAILAIVGIVFLVLILVKGSDPAPVEPTFFDPNRPLHSFDYCGNRKMVSFTFDDGPDVAHTPSLLRDLATLGIKGSFFIAPGRNGPPTSTQCNVVRQVIAEGHSVHSHSYDHSDFTQLSNDEIRLNLQKSKQWIDNCLEGTGLSTPFDQFRPPFGALTSDQAEYISKLGYTIASWTIDSQDVRGLGREASRQVINSEFENLQPDTSVVILMHDHLYHDAIDGIGGLLIDLYNDFVQRGYSFGTSDQCYNSCDPFSTICKHPRTTWPGTFDI